MKNADLKSLSVDELWDLHEQVVVELDRKIAAEKHGETHQVGKEIGKGCRPLRVSSILLRNSYYGLV